VTSARAELMALGGATSAAPSTGLDVAPAPAPQTTGEQAVLASWRQLLDDGTLQRDEPAMAGTARPSVARLGKDAAGRLGLADGDLLTVSGPAGEITLPVQLVEMPDRVVWLPMRSPGSDVRAGLGAGPGSVVTLSSVPPTPATATGGAA
jgi:NADH-quinone oxidoreductase subunit G